MLRRLAAEQCFREDLRRACLALCQQAADQNGIYGGLCDLWARKRVMYCVEVSVLCSSASLKNGVTVACKISAGVCL